MKKFYKSEPGLIAELTLCIFMDFPLYIDTSMGLPIMYYRGLR